MLQKNIQIKVESFAYFIDEIGLSRLSSILYYQTCKKGLEKRGKNLDKWVPVGLCKIKGIVGVMHLVDEYCCQLEFPSFVVVT